MMMQKCRTNLVLTVLGAAMLLQTVLASAEGVKFTIGQWYKLTSHEGIAHTAFTKAFKENSLIKLCEIKNASSAGMTQLDFKDNSGKKSWVDKKKIQKNQFIPLSFPEEWKDECAAMFSFMQEHHVVKGEGENSEGPLKRFQIGDWVKAAGRSGTNFIFGSDSKFKNDQYGEVIGFGLQKASGKNGDKKLGRPRYKIHFSHKKDGGEIRKRKQGREKTAFIKASNWTQTQS
jgi:hypothetical protein